jgi:aspartyl-tRNA(Asn)/glutamyl-tRNA(Gln) amidotransferase subunit B
VTNPEFEPVIGLEVHVQLSTASKLFCGCPAASFGAPPNSHVCPVCTGQPGALPVLNRRAVELGFTAALAVGARIRSESVFARKNYFYPDLPKGYQISQFEEPFSQGGSIALPDGRSIRLHRIHMEEDAGKLVHDIGAEVLPYSLVDFNRSSVPLCEIVSEPDIRSAHDAFLYLTELKAILQYLGVSTCDMEKGEMRCDANVSLRPAGQAAFGTKAEIKNLNSFKAVRDAIEAEIVRQAKLLKEGGRVVQETRLWDDAARETRPMRSKEEAHDYRYFPEPDLVPLAADPELIERLKRAQPELPRARRARFVEKLGLSDYDAGVLTASRILADYFEAAVAASKGGVKPKAVANWVGTEFLAKLNASGGWTEGRAMSAGRLAELLSLVEDGTLSGKLAKEVFAQAWDSDESPAALVKKQGLAQVSDEGQLRAWAEEAIREAPKAVQDFQSGNERAIGALVGAVMKKSKGKANPGKINELLKELLKQVPGRKS